MKKRKFTTLCSYFTLDNMLDINIYFDFKFSSNPTFLLNSKEKGNYLSVRNTFKELL